MSDCERNACTRICALADHLDTALVACDDLLKGSAQRVDALGALRLELTAITHVLQARHSAAEMLVEDHDLSRWLASFVSETALLEEASSADVAQKIRQQAAKGALLGGRIPIVDLKPVLASLLDSLESHYSLHPDGREDGAPAAPWHAVQEAQMWARSSE
jgi:hypothetical protein